MNDCLKTKYKVKFPLKKKPIKAMMKIHIKIRSDV